MATSVCCQVAPVDGAPFAPSMASTTPAPTWASPRAKTKTSHEKIKTSAVVAVCPPLVANEAHPSSQYTYQLSISQPLPSIDLSHTLVEFCSHPWRTRMIALMVAHYRHFAMLHRIASVTFLVLLFLAPSMYRHIATVFVFCCMSTMVSISLFMSIDIFKLQLKSHDFLFITVINLINWGCLVILLGDLRVLMCIPSWYASQVAITMDANFRTFPTALRSIAISIPAVLSISLFCAFDKIYEPRTRVIFIGTHTLTLANVLTYTASTLAIFMGKKVALKLWRSHTTFTGFNIIPCVVLRAKMRLHGIEVTRRPQLPGLGLEAIHHATSFPHVQTIFLSKLSLNKVDATHCFLPRCFFFRSGCLQVDHHKPRSWWFLVPLYAMGVLGYTSLIVKFALASFYHDLPSADNAQRVLSLIALPCTTVFCGALALHFQRDLMYALLANFDYLFSTYQVVAMSLCIADLADWDSTLSIAAFSWLMWYQLALTIDALTPLVKQRLRLRKRFVAPVLFALLVESMWIIIQVITQKRDLFQRSRTLIKLSVSSQHTFRITTEQMLIERAVTILGWLGSRFVAELIFAQEDELMFIRGLVEYMSPYDTFPPKKTTRAQVGVNQNGASIVSIRAELRGYNTSARVTSRAKVPRMVDAAK